ncbi:MAG: hypothetical protein FWE02_04330 [Defluviitaleaceae bacterium]|nr:hypothetical protein [Defluviitaleaceae bacterium]
MDVYLNSDFQYGTWIPSLQIGNGIIQGEYTDRTGNWTRIGHQIFINGFFRLNYNEAQVEEAIRRNTTVQELRMGTLPFEANSSSSIFNLMVSNSPFIRNNRPDETEVLSIGARSIWGSPRMRVFTNERAITGSLDNVNRMPVSVDLFLQDLRTSTNGVFTEVRISGTYTAFPDLSTTDIVNTPPPTIMQPVPTPTIGVGSRVRINPTAHTWATGQSIPTWVLGQIYRVNRLRNDDQELLLEGVNSWIRVEDVTLV